MKIGRPWSRTRVSVLSRPIAVVAIHPFMMGWAVYRGLLVLLHSHNTCFFPNLFPSRRRRRSGRCLSRHLVGDLHTLPQSLLSMKETTESDYYTEEEVEEGVVEAERGQEEKEDGHGSEGEEEVGGGKRKRPLKSLDGLSKRGVCYLSRVPPHMNPSHVRQMFSKYGEVQRIYLVPEGQGHRKHANVRAKAYSEGWIEFAKKSVAKRVASLLNGEQIGGKKRSSFYYDIWNIKYLRKFKWDDLVGEIAEKTHIREQKLTLEITAAKKQRDHYLNNAEKSRTQKYIRERIKKKQKTEGKESNDGLETKIGRPILQQKRAVEERGPKTKSKLSKNILAGVFSGSS